MSFRRRNYLELMDNLLTRLVGGVAAETYPFPPAAGHKPPYKHPLEQPPVKKITSVYGLHNNQNYQFKVDVDFELLDEQILQWKEGAVVPDHGSTFQVNYFSEAKAGQISDIHIGSVARTLMEASALEIAGLYAQLQAVYDAGFVDTASGSSLDNVVALLGVERVRAGRNTVTLAFQRSKGNKGEIFIPAGTRVLSQDGAIEYETTASITMVDGQAVVKVAARDLVEANDPIEGGQLTILAKPISGIDSVNNPEASNIADADEEDNDLRSRAKNFLHGSERGTLASIKHAIARQQVLADVEEDAPGVVKITFHSDTFPPEQKARIEKAVDDVRPAGILIDYHYASAPQEVDLEMRITTANDLAAEDLRHIQNEIQKRIADYFKNLQVKAAGSINKIIGSVLEDPSVQDVRILSATVADTDVLDRDSGVLAIKDVPTVLGELTVTDPNLPTILQINISFPKNVDAVDQTQIENSISQDVAYLNEINAVELAADAAAVDLQKQQLSFGKLLQILPLPGKGNQSLAIYDSLFGTPDEPVLPDNSDLSSYEVQWIFVTETGLSYVINDESSANYVLSDFERLSLGGVEVTVTAAEEGIV